MKIGRIRIMTEKTYQTEIKKAVRLAEIGRDKTNAHLLKLSICKNAELTVQNHKLMKVRRCLSRN